MCEMICLACGHCCRTMSPISGGEPCPHLRWTGTIARCAVYAARPEQCRAHEYSWAPYCPIGVDVLGFEGPEQVAQRIDAIWALEPPCAR